MGPSLLLVYRGAGQPSRTVVHVRCRPRELSTLRQNGARVSANRSGGIQVISRAAQVLRALDGAPEGLSLSQLAERVALPRSTVHRLTTALAAEGLIAAASPNGRVRLGPELTRLAIGA